MNVLITGGASGLGQAITRKTAAAETNRVYFTYNTSHAAASAIEKEFPNTTGLKCDFSSASELENLLARMPGMGLDVVVHNAISGMVKKHFHKIDPDVFRESFSCNIMPIIRITQQALTLFRKKKFGKIISILTAAIVNRPPTGWSEYVANKAYLLSLNKSWAVENASFNITANCISPSFMQTAFTRDMDERIAEEMISNHPLKRLLTPEEVADAVIFFMGAPQHINGTNLIINAAADVI
jgi:NAD(P)-dependent dehydrogenase (short-subunit alcohol dehydrogenase family)